MLANPVPTFLLASADPALLAMLEPLLAESGARTQVALSADAALEALTAPGSLNMALLDTKLPGMKMADLLARAQAERTGRRAPIVLISDTVTQEWADRLAEGVIDDLIPRSLDPQFLWIRLESVLRASVRKRELEMLREAAALNEQTDRLTGVYNRATILSMLFRETDRVQRMNTSLCMILFDVDDFGHWNSRLGPDACDELLCEVVRRTSHLMRSYDLIGRVGKDEFLLALPGCSNVNSVMMAERIRLDVFSRAFQLAGQSFRLSACFGIVSSNGRSPVVVLREAEQALQMAKAAGPESIQCIGDYPEPAPPPFAFLPAPAADELLPW